MSTYEDEMDNCYAICPYCQYKYEVEGEDYSEYTREDDCEECGKTYKIHQSFSVDHHTEPDCELNGEEHVWESHSLRDGRSHDFCGTCGMCRRHDQ